MSIFILNINFKQYQIFGVTVILCVFIYLAIQNIRGLIKFKNESGKTYSSLFTPYDRYNLKSEIKVNAELAQAYKKWKSQSNKLLFVWISIIALLIIGAAIVKNATAISN